MPDNRDYQRPKTSPIGVVVAPADPEGTGVHEGSELAAIRARRPTPQRIARLEERADKTDTVMAHVTGRVDAIFEMTAAAEEARQARELREATAAKERAEASTRRWKTIVPLVTGIIAALGVAIAGIVSAVR